MATGITPVICPQCHSNNVRMESETRGVCESCGTALIIEEKGEERDVRIEGEEDKCEFDPCVALIPEYDKNRFLKEAWIAVAKEDAPLSVFGHDFDEVSEKIHEVIIDSLTVGASYRASVGYDRQEPYTAYEDTIENETYYENGQRYTRRVTRQRPVTRYKTVTDWHPLQAELEVDSAVTVDNNPGAVFDEDLFSEAFCSIPSENAVPLLREKAAEMKTSDAAESEISDKHLARVRREIAHALPGDRYKDLDYKIISVKNSSRGMFVSCEYEATLTFDGKTYVKRAFPFGYMKIGGDAVDNGGGFEATAEKMKAEIPSRVWNKTKANSYLTAALLALSIVTSLFIHVRIPVVALFIAAAAAFIYNAVKVGRVKRKETEKVEAEIAKSSEKHREKLLKALNGKLAALGFEPVTADSL